VDVLARRTVAHRMVLKPFAQLFHFGE